MAKFLEATAAVFLNVKGPVLSIKNPDIVFQSHFCLKMPFPTHVLVTLTKEGSFSCPPEEFREKMMAALKIYFLKKLEEEPWSDVEPALCYEEQCILLFKEK